MHPSFSFNKPQIGGNFVETLRDAGLDFFPVEGNFGVTVQKNIVDICSCFFEPIL